MAELRKELVRVSEGKRWSDVKPVVINNATDVHTKDVMNLRQFCGYVCFILESLQTSTCMF
jgi:protein glucosyltransferase